MSKISLTPNASGTGNFTIASPNSNTDRTLTLPDATGTINTSGAVNEVPAGTASAPSIYPTGDTNTGIFFPAADTIGFTEGGAEAMRIDTSGNVLVGKTGTGFSTNGIELRADNELWVTKDSSIPMSLNRKTTTGELTRFHYNGTKVGDISTNGTGTTYNSSSDYRLKENIQPMTGALDKVAQLKPVTYTWKADGSNGQGFIAHELQEVVPDCVTGEKDAVNEDGSINPQGIDTSKLVATLTAAIQEQQTIIETLKADIAELKAKVNV